MFANLIERPRFFVNDHGFNLYQSQFWTYLSGQSHLHEHGNGLYSAYAENPVFTEHLKKRWLYLPEDSGSMVEMVEETDMPRITSIIIKNDMPVGHAIIVPTTAKNGRYGTPPIPTQAFGYKIGLVAVFVADEHRGLDYASLLLWALAQRIKDVPMRRRMTLMAEGPLVPLARRVFPRPVIARLFTERATHEKPIIR